MYRVSQQVSDLGWVDFDLDVPLIMPSFSASSATFPSAQAESGGQRNSQNQSQPNPGQRPAVSLSTLMKFLDSHVHMGELFESDDVGGGVVAASSIGAQEQLLPELWARPGDQDDGGDPAETAVRPPFLGQHLDVLCVLHANTDFEPLFTRINFQQCQISLWRQINEIIYE